METATIETGPYGANCTIAGCGGIALVADPGADAPEIESALGRLSLVPAAVILTHAHFDHIGAVPALQRLHPGLPVYLHPADYSVIGHPMNSNPPHYPPIASLSGLRDARTLAADFPQFGVETIETPGHTPGGVGYYFAAERLLLSGDTLFAGSAGRTDFPGGDLKALLASLSRLAALPPETEVVPGHGRRTTIAAERRTNPFLLRLA